MNKRQRDEKYPHILAKQGEEFCIKCGRNKLLLKKDGEKPEFCIDHIDNNNNNNSLDNLQFLCHSCNTKKNHPQTTEPYERKATPELILGKAYEKKFRRWVVGKFEEGKNALEYSFVLNSGAEFIGCSQETLKRYLAKMTSDNGMYEWEERFAGTFMVLKPQFR